MKRTNAEKVQIIACGAIARENPESMFVTMFAGILDLDTVPEHLVIIGGSYIGLEFAQMFRRFGAEVTVVERGPRLASREDDDVCAAIKDILEREGIAIHLGSNDIRVAKDGDGISVSTGSAVVKGSHLLVAVGRVPNTDDLGLEKAGVATDSRGYVTVDDQLRTSVDHIWALGDCNGKGAFTHTSYNDFEIVAANLLDNEPRRVSDRIPTYALYIDPPLGRAGMTEAQVRASGRKALVGKRPMTRVGRAVEKGETQGFMKVLVDAETNQILGASILGVGGDEVVDDAGELVRLGPAGVIGGRHRGAVGGGVGQAKRVEPGRQPRRDAVIAPADPANEQLRPAILVEQDGARFELLRLRREEVHHHGLARAARADHREIAQVAVVEVEEERRGAGQIGRASCRERVSSPV